MNYDVIDKLALVANYPDEWKKRFGNQTLLEVLEKYTGKKSDVIQFGEVATAMSGVHGKAVNMIRSSQVRRVNSVEKQPKSKATIAIVRRKNGEVTVKRNIGGKWCNTTKKVIM